MYVYVCAHWGWLAAETVSFVVCIIGNINEPHFLHYFVSVYRPFLSWSPIIFPDVIFFNVEPATCHAFFGSLLLFFFFSTVYIFFGTFSPFYQDVKKKKSNNIAIRRNCTIFTCPNCEAKRTSHILRKKIAIKYHLYKGVFDDIQISLLWPPWQVGICDNHYNICGTSWNCSSNCGSGIDSSR